MFCYKLALRGCHCVNGYYFVPCWGLLRHIFKNGKWSNTYLIIQTMYLALIQSTNNENFSQVVKYWPQYNILSQDAYLVDLFITPWIGWGDNMDGDFLIYDILLIFLLSICIIMPSNQYHHITSYIVLWFKWIPIYIFIYNYIYFTSS